MRITLERTLFSNGGVQQCAICFEPFWIGAVTAFASTDEGLRLGETCATCLEEGPEGISATLRARADAVRAYAEKEEELALEPVWECPVPEELALLEKIYDTLRYDGLKEADC